MVLTGGTSRPVGDGAWTVDGDLRIRDITQPIALTVSFRGMTTDARGKTKVALAVAAETQRADYELTTELREESGEPGTGPDIEIRADVEAFLGEEAPGIPSDR